MSKESIKMDILLGLIKKGYNLQDTEESSTMSMELGNGYTLLASVKSNWLITFKDGNETVKYQIDSTKVPYSNAKDARTLHKEFQAACAALAFEGADDVESVEESVPEETETVSEPSNWSEGGFNQMKNETQHIQDAVYEDIGEQRKVNLPKPGRRIKNLDAELMKGGTIRAGDKILSKNGKPMPHKTPYLTVTKMTKRKDVVPNDPNDGYERDEYIHSIVGDKPTRLKVRLACDREDLNFITYYGKYKSAACECRGDGYSAQKFTGEIILCAGDECQTFKAGECKRYGKLKVILEDAKSCGIIYTFITTSRNSISNLSASLALLTGCSNGHIAGLPLELTLTPKDTVIPTTGKRTTIYMANLEYRGTYVEMQQHIQDLLLTREGRNPIREFERIAEAALDVPESPDECKDIHETFCPDMGEAQA
jgi:hypothetical protein